MKVLRVAFTGILMLVLISCFAQPISKEDKAFIISKAILLLKENYIFPDRVAAIGRQVTQQLKGGKYDSLTEQQEFLNVLNQHFQTFGNDHHLNIFIGPSRVKQIIADALNEREGKEETTTAEWLQKMRYENFRLRKVERLDGNIGYFNFLSFTPLAPSKQSITSAMNFLLYSDAIIIDLRENGGGYAQTMNFLLSYFLKDSMPVATLRYRKENRLITSYTIRDSSINKIPDSIPLYILVSRRTSSAAEGFAYALQQYKRATIIGEQTKGEGNPGRLFVIDDALYMMIPTAEAINTVSKKSIDGIGVIPDIPVEKSKALTKALLDANTALAAKSADIEMKRLYQWQIPLLEQELHPEHLTDTIIHFLVGNYEGGRKIMYENNAVYYINTKGEKEKLEYIGKGVFQNIAKSFLRLVMPYTDKPITAFRWIWDDGGTPQQVVRVPN